MNQLLTVSFPYGWKPSPDQAELLKSYTKGEVKFEADGSLSWSSRTQMLTIDEALSMGTEFTVEKATGLSRHISTVAQHHGPGPINEKCHVAIAGVSMLHIDTVKVFNDACTDGLQELLGDGWRILAILVQPDQRRPDYVLGRSSS